MCQIIVNWSTIIVNYSHWSTHLQWYLKSPKETLRRRGIFFRHLTCPNMINSTNILIRNKLQMPKELACFVGIEWCITPVRNILKYFQLIGDQLKKYYTNYIILRYITIYIRNMKPRGPYLAILNNIFPMRLQDHWYLLVLLTWQLCQEYKYFQAAASIAETFIYGSMFLILVLLPWQNMHIFQFIKNVHGYCT